MRSVSQHPVRRTAPLRVAPGMALVVAVVASVALAGCTSDSPDADPSPAATSATGSPTASAPPSGTPSPSGPPTLPTEAQGRSKAAAVAFVEHWIDVINYTGETLDTGPLRELSAPSCGSCRALIEATDELQRRGGRIEGQVWRAVEVVQQGSTDPMQVSAVIAASASETYPRKGAEPIASEAARGFFRFELRPHNNTWKVTLLERDAS